MRETGPTAKVYVSDQGNSAEAQRLAAPYVGAARTLLGALKNDMGFNGLDQGQRFQDFPDGTRIVVESRFGQDKFTITTAPPAPPEPRLAEPPHPELPEPPPVLEPVIPTELEAELFAACGYCQTGGVQVAVAWRTLGAVPIVVSPDGAHGAQAFDISGSGRSVVGYYAPATGGSNRAFAYSVATGVVTLAGAGPAAALATSYSGRTTVGYCQSSDGLIGQVPCAWTADEGLVELPREAAGGRAMCVSPSGEYAAGLDIIPFANGNNVRAVVWRRDPNNRALWVRRTIDNPGTASRESSFQGPVTDPRDDHYTPINVDDQGRVTLVLNHYDGSYVSGIQRWWKFHDSGTSEFPAGSGVQAAEGEWCLVSPNGYYQIAAPTGAGFFRYTFSDTLLVTLETGTAVSVADEVQIALGVDSYNAVVALWGGPYTPGQHLYSSADPPAHLGDLPATQTGYLNYRPPENQVDRSWWWSQLHGKVFLRPDNALATDISEDGRAIVGYKSASGRTPCYWLRSQGLAVDMQFIGEQGVAWACCRSAVGPLSN